MYKFITLDFWNTIATPNPAFAKERNEYLHSQSSLSLEAIRTIYTETKADFDQAAEMSGEAYSAIGCAGILLEMINPYLLDDDIIYRHAIKLSRDIQLLALVNPPIIAYELIQTIRSLRAKGFGIGIISNTNFISGATIRQICATRNCKFDTYSFSDELAVAKPNPNIFTHNAHQSGSRADEIIHIGDNAICDGGAEALGIKTVIVKNPTETITALQELL